MPLSETTKGTLAVLTAGWLWALNGVVSKYLMNNGLDPVSLAQARVSLAALFALAWLALRSPGQLKIRRADILPLALLGLVGLTAVNTCYILAIKLIPTAAAVLLEYMGVALIALYAWLFMAEPMRPLKLAALALAFGGCFLTVGGYDLDLLSLNLTGVLWGLGAAFAFGFYCVFTEYRLRNSRPWTVVFYALLWAALAYNLVLGPGWLADVAETGVRLGLVCFSALFGTVFPFGLMTYGIKRLRATRATITSIFEPVATGLIAYAWLGETMSGWQMLGGAAVLAAVYLIQRERAADQAGLKPPTPAV